jgi:predicted MFS family arabinose efflux permease
MEKNKNVKGVLNMNKKKVVWLLGLSGFIVMADNWVVSPILPAISQHLNPTTQLID